MSYKHPDLLKRLQNVSEARRFIEEFDWSPGPKPPHVLVELDRLIPLDNSKISDEEAVIAAIEILHGVLIADAFRESHFSRWHH